MAVLCAAQAMASGMDTMWHGSRCDRMQCAADIDGNNSKDIIYYYLFLGGAGIVGTRGGLPQRGG